MRSPPVAPEEPIAGEDSNSGLEVAATAIAATAAVAIEALDSSALPGPAAH